MRALQSAITVTSKLQIIIGLAFLASAETPPKPGDVTEPRVLTDSANWLVGGRDFNEQHFSPLKQVTDQNIGKLGLAWATDIESAMGLATEPIVVDGVIYLSLPQSRVFALDATSGKVLWRFDPKVRLDRMRNSWSARSNRGLAVWAGKVYVGAGDCRLVAIDAASGEKAWESPVCDGSQTGITGAPHVAKGKVFIGYNGSPASKPGDSGPFPEILPWASNRKRWRWPRKPGPATNGGRSAAATFGTPSPMTPPQDF